MSSATPRWISPLAAPAHATTVGVASGHYRAEELHSAQTDHVLQSLTDPFPGLDGGKAGKESG